jgi:hypothetical protein
MLAIFLQAIVALQETISNKARLKTSTFIISYFVGLIFEEKKNSFVIY